MDSNILCKFESKMCMLCGINGINQYFEIGRNFIEYNGVYHSLHEILNEALNFNFENENSLEICLDCKDKIIKFYHFKRKVHETQMKYSKAKNVTKSFNSQKPIKSKQSKVVHNICEIVKNYTDKCSIVKIRVNENTKKLIIEPNEEHQEEVNYSSEETENEISLTPVKIKEEQESDISENTNLLLWKNNSQNNNEQTNLIDFNDVITIKQEPEELPDITFEEYSDKYLEETDSTTYTRKSFEHTDSERPISKAALKMRKYREKLKLPENREKFLEHKERQKFWNRRHYLRKQAKSNKYSRSPRIYNEFDNFFIS